jgi:hypothetical protein
LQHKERCYPTADGWLFANPVTGKPYHQEQIQKNHLTKATSDAGIKGEVGWHTFRHSYRSWMDDTGAPLTVQQELMRPQQGCTDGFERAETCPPAAAKGDGVLMGLDPMLRFSVWLVAGDCNAPNALTLRFQVALVADR